MERLAAKPTAGVPQACRGWGETMAAYRFFDNGEVEGYYNRQRLHTSIDFRTPVDYEAALLTA